MEEFLAHAKDPATMAYLTMLKIDVADAEKLFRLIARTSHKGETLNLDDFISGCQTFKGFAKKLDVILIMDQLQVLTTSLEAIADRLPAV